MFHVELLSLIRNVKPETKKLEIKKSPFHVEQKENKVNSENRLKRFAENNKIKCF